MGLLHTAKDLITGFTQSIGTSWWLEITTAQPQCTYYFGPFDGAADAESAKPGFLEDLHHEGAQGITTIIKRCKPAAMTICDELD
jgi:hypothetical protein